MWIYSRMSHRFPEAEAEAGAGIRGKLPEDCVEAFPADGGSFVFRHLEHVVGTA